MWSFYQGDVTGCRGSCYPVVPEQGCDPSLASQQQTLCHNALRNSKPSSWFCQYLSDDIMPGKNIFSEHLQWSLTAETFM